jgi:aminoglycoside 2'-N-acetyltransferase I
VTSTPTGWPAIRSVTTPELTEAEQAALWALMTEAFPAAVAEERFTRDDWAHALGGRHFLAELDGRIVAHAAVVPRELHVDGRPLRTGYVEAVATAPGLQGRGIGSGVMRAAAEHILEAYELGALGTGEQGFYERLGWLVWHGPTFVRTLDGDRRTADEDGGIMVLRTPATETLDLAAAISCDDRVGDDW